MSYHRAYVYEVTCDGCGRSLPSGDFEVGRFDVKGEAVDACTTADWDASTLRHRCSDCIEKHGTLPRRVNAP